MYTVPTEVSPPPERTSVRGRHRYASGVPAGQTTARDESKGVWPGDEANLILLFS